MSERLRVKVDGKWYSVEVLDMSSKPIRAVVDGHPVDVNIEEAVPTVASAIATAPQTEANAAAPAAPSSSPEPVSQAPTPEAEPRAAPAPSPGRVTGNVLIAPMPGTILSVEVGVGDTVQVGDHVCTLEAMKMQQSLRADWTGVVSEVFVNPGDRVLDNAPILAIG